MEKLKYTGRITHLSFDQIWSYRTLKECEFILDLLTLKTGKSMIKGGCRIKGVKHYYAYKTSIWQTVGTVKTGVGESPGVLLVKNDGSDNFTDYTFRQLKELYRGENTILRSSIEECDCSKTMDCETCKGTGICAGCHGTKCITCPVCGGEKECPSCDGTGKYKCRHCDGTGECPDCDGDGTEECSRCEGEGENECWTCEGSGQCPNCNGTGWYDNGRKTVTCRRCGGTGQCPSCDGGNKHFYCNVCGGDGNVSCVGCNGTGKCHSCGGHGDVWCKACRGSGICGKCQGHGKIKCPDCSDTGNCTVCDGSGKVKCSRCEGLGKYQTYKKFTIVDSTDMEIRSLINCESGDLQGIVGNILFEDTVYEMFRQHFVVHNYESSCENLDAEYMHYYKCWLDFGRWNTEDKTVDHYFCIKVKNVRFPVTAIEVIAGSDSFTVYIMGTNSIVFYDHLPSFFNRLCGFMKMIFNK